MSTIDYSSYENALNLARKALEFYGNEMNYIGEKGNPALIDLDHHLVLRLIFSCVCLFEYHNSGEKCLDLSS